MLKQRFPTRQKGYAKVKPEIDEETEEETDLEDDESQQWTRINRGEKFYECGDDGMNGSVRASKEDICKYEV